MKVQQSMFDAFKMLIFAVKKNIMNFSIDH